MYGTAVKRIVEEASQPLLPAENAAPQEHTEAAEEKTNLMKQDPEGFRKETFWEELCGRNTTQEMVSYLEQVAGEYPEVLSTEVVQKAKNCITLERIYGRAVGVQEVQKLIKKHLEQ